jgi:hypothetical protein
MKGTFWKVIAVLVFLALAGNLLALSGLMTSDDERVEGMRMLVWTVFAALVAGNLFAGVAGVVLTTKAHEKHEKSSLLWLRRAFVVAIVETGLMAAGPWLFVLGEADLSLRVLVFCLVLFPFGVLIGVFAMAAWREYVRVVGRGGRSHSLAHRHDGHGPSAES